MCFFKKLKKVYWNYTLTNICTSDMINFDELNLICSKNIKGLLKAEILKHSEESVKVRYECFDYLTLEKFLEKPIKSIDLCRIITDIFDTLRRLSEYNLKIENINIDIKRIFIDKDDNSVYFLYLPLISNDKDVNFRNLMLNILRSVKLRERKGIELKKSLFASVYSKEKFSLDDLKVLMQLVLKNEKYLKAKFNLDFSVEENEYIGHRLLTEDELNEYTTQYMNSVFNKDECSNGAIIQKAYLNRERTGEKFLLYGEIMVIGKSDDCDCVIDGNRAISRRHAQFIKYNSRFFINDLNSTNKTYVNNEEVKYGIRSEVHKDDTIRLANEDFIFTIE